MSSIIELLEELERLDAFIRLDGERLRVNAPRGAVSPDLRAELSAHRDEFMALLRQTNVTVAPITPVSRAEPIPASFAQQRLWFLEQIESNSVAYNIALACRLTGKLNRSILAQALAKVVERHEALRTAIVTVQGNPIQVIAPPGQTALTVIDLSHLPAHAWQSEVIEQAKREANTHFDLEKGPLFRTTLLQLDDTNAVFILTIHHIISDGWSVNIFFEELFTLYNALFQNNPSPLPELPIQYADFSVWQRQRLAGNALISQLEYWRNYLKDAPDAIDLPADYPRPPGQSFKGDTYRFTLPETLSRQLAQFSHKNGVTLFMTLLAAFHTLLYRYTGQTDLVTGSPVANRTRPEVENIIGFFVNTLLFRTKFADTLTFMDVLQQVRHNALNAYAHQDLPFDKLVEALNPPRDLSRNPLFQIMFALQNTPDHTQPADGLQITELALPGKTSKFDLTLTIDEGPNQLNAVIEYSTDLFAPDTIKRMAGHWQTLLEAAVTSPATLVSHLPLLTPAERRQLLVEWNDTATPIPSDSFTHRQFEAQVERTPEKVALVFAEQSLTYAQLNARANQLAHYLQERGAGPEVLVGLNVERSVEMVVGLLAILKTGGAYLPLDPLFPPDRLAFMLADSGAKLLLTQSRLIGTLPLTNKAVVNLDEDWGKIGSYPTSNPVSAVTEQNLAYVIYTSGSTGKPKGVQLPHLGMANFLNSMRREPGLTGRDILLSVTTPSFDISVLEIFLTLTTGARLVLVSAATAADGARLSVELAQSQATVMQATPATWQMLIEAGWPGSPRLKILCGGETLSSHLAAQLLPRCAELWNMYGPTETTVWSTLFHVQSAQHICIGRPIANTQVYILDAQLQPMPIGITGEFYIGGEGLARGYLNRPELTAEKFIPNPFGEGRLYKTGDLARYRPDGALDFLGRIDHQVKIRGFRIELGEIETVLSQHPAIRQAVVVVREDIPGQKRLAAYLIAANGEPSVSDLRNNLKNNLPDYMVPSLFVFVDSYPLTPNGKINRRALPAPDSSRPVLETTYAAPKTEVERLITLIWQEVLHLEKVGIYDNFFDLGGHSLMIMQVHNKLYQLFNKELSIVDMFRYPTIASLSNYLKQSSSDQPGLQKSKERARLQNQIRQIRRKGQ